MQKELDISYKWAQENLMEFNEEKSQKDKLWNDQKYISNTVQRSNSRSN